jgi:hypothetical protein
LPVQSITFASGEDNDLPTSAIIPSLINKSPTKVPLVTVCSVPFSNKKLPDYAFFTCCALILENMNVEQRNKYILKVCILYYL